MYGIVVRTAKGIRKSAMAEEPTAKANLANSFQASYQLQKQKCQP
jgi:hypothetical protein